MTDNLGTNVSRYQALRESKLRYEHYLRKCISFKVIKEDDVGFFVDPTKAGSQNPDTARTRKIAMFKASKQAKERIAVSCLYGLPFIDELSWG